ncbi:MAG: arsenate reductase ArsC [Thermodesulfobacteriota bacterium]
MNAPIRKLKILFLCTGNSCRSQMAEGWAKALKPDLVQAYSAGVEPKAVDPRAVRAMAEAGVDISGQWAKDVAELGDIQFDWVVTLCDHARESCPLFPGRVQRLHMGFADPPFLAQDAGSEEEAMDHYRRVRDEIKAFVAGLPASLQAKEE